MSVHTAQIQSEGLDKPQTHASTGGLTPVSSTPCVSATPRALDHQELLMIEGCKTCPGDPGQKTARQLNHLHDFLRDQWHEATICSTVVAQRARQQPSPRTAPAAPPAVSALSGPSRHSRCTAGTTTTKSKNCCRVSDACTVCTVRACFCGVTEDQKSDDELNLRHIPRQVRLGLLELQLREHRDVTHQNLLLGSVALPSASPRRPVFVYRPGLAVNPPGRCHWTWDVPPIHQQLRPPRAATWYRTTTT